MGLSHSHCVVCFTNNPIQLSGAFVPPVWAHTRSVGSTCMHPPCQPEQVALDASTCSHRNMGRENIVLTTHVRSAMDPQLKVNPLYLRIGIGNFMYILIMGS